MQFTQDLSNFHLLSYRKFPDLLSELLTMLQNNVIEWCENEICLNTIESNTNDFRLGTGSLLRNWKDKKTSANSLEYNLKESDFTTLCDVFKNTEFENIYNYVVHTMRVKVGRVRLMRINSGSCYSWHNGLTKRIHYVLDTSPGAGLIVENEVAHLEENNWYEINTKKFHTEFNASLHPRIHLVFVVL